MNVEKTDNEYPWIVQTHLYSQTWEEREDGSKELREIIARCTGSIISYKKLELR